MLKRFFIGFLFSGILFTAFSQSLPLPKDNPIAIAAPHLPLMVRYDGAGKIFYGENMTYKFEANETSLKAWLKAYPEELPTYKVAIDIYLKAAEATTPTDKNKELYRDLKSQWQMVLQF